MFRNIDKRYWIGELDRFRRCTGKGLFRHAGEKEIHEIEIIGFGEKYLYEGEINDLNLPHGFGKLFNKTSCYKGQFLNGSVIGFFNAKINGIEYEGFLSEGKFIGPGIFYKPGCAHLIGEGEFINFPR